MDAEKEGWVLKIRIEEKEVVRSLSEMSMEESQERGRSKPLHAKKRVSSIEAGRPSGKMQHR